jgi:hypothetical protein
VGKVPQRTSETDLDAVGESLVAYGAPLGGWAPKKRLLLEEALAGGVLLAKQNATVLSVLPVVLAKTAEFLDPPALTRAAQKWGVASEMGMLLALTGEVTGNRTLAQMATGYPRCNTPTFFLETDNATSGLRRLALERTPQVVRKWGFWMNASLDDFADRVRKFA